MTVVLYKATMPNTLSDEAYCKWSRIDVIVDVKVCTGWNMAVINRAQLTNRGERVKFGFSLKTGISSLHYA